MSESFRALYAVKGEKGPEVSLKTLESSALPDRPLLIRVEYSTVNYKDGLAITGKGKILQAFPIVPGVDYAGVIEQGGSGFEPGDRVAVNGFGVGEEFWGGYAELARAEPGWAVKLPGGISTWEAMAIGTAGLTSMLCVMALEAHKIRPDSGDVLVTGAAGGVGSVAIALLARLGYRVVASSGRPETHDYLRSLGAAEFIDRDALLCPVKPLASQRFAGAIDAVGGKTLANILSMMMFHGCVAATGLAGGSDLPATVHPFILRGVTLAGVNSVYCPLADRLEAWRRLAELLPKETIRSMAETIGLADVLNAAKEIVAGRVKGRLVVDVRR